MAKFKPGDEVILLNPLLSKDLKGEIFTVKEVKKIFSSVVYIVEENNNSWLSTEFELARPYLQKEEARKLLGLLPKDS